MKIHRLLFQLVKRGDTSDGTTERIENNGRFNRCIRTIPRLLVKNMFSKSLNMFSEIVIVVQLIVLYASYITRYQLKQFTTGWV